ncbi:MAG: hypothetical protein ABI401_12680 [Candidatus Dormibacter sp.]
MAEFEGVAVLAGKHREKGLQACEVELEISLELEKEWPEFVAQSLGGLDHHLDGFMLDGHALDMADVPARLHRE